MPGQARHDGGRCLRAGHDHGLLVQRRKDLGRQVLAHAQRELGQVVGERLVAGSGKRTWRRVALKQIEHRRMVKVRSDNAVERRMDLSEQVANSVAGLSDLGGEVVIEAAQHGGLGELLVGQSNRVHAALSERLR